MYIFVSHKSEYVSSQIMLQ